MGLAERRAAQNFKDIDFKAFVSDAQTVCGFAIEVDCDWTSVENHTECVRIHEGRKYGLFWFEPMLTALKAICSDEMGKSAFKSKVHKLCFFNGTGKLEMQDHTFILRNALDGSGSWGADQIRAFLEKQL